MKERLDERVYAKLVWYSPDGVPHYQWTAEGDPLRCRCGLRHLICAAPVTQVCAGGEHTVPGTRACVLCGLSWRVPGVVQVIPAGPLVTSLPAEYTDVKIHIPPAPAPRCIYCEVLAQYPLDLARHRVQAH